MRKITALLLRLSAIIITLTNFGFSAGLTSTLRMFPSQDASIYTHLLLAPGLIILVSLLVAFNADRIARFICRDDEDLSFGQVTGHEIAKIGVSLFALSIILAAVFGFIHSTTSIVLIDSSNADDLTSQIRSSTYISACVRFFVQIVLGGYLLLKPNRISNFISGR